MEPCAGCYFYASRWPARRWRRSGSYLADAGQSSFLSPEFGWSSGQEKFQTTSDGGRSWVPVQTPIRAGGLRLHDERLRFVDSKAAWFYAGDSLYWTLDGGSTWEGRTLLDGVLELHFSNRNEGVATVWKSQPSTGIHAVPSLFSTIPGPPTHPNHPRSN